MDGSRTSGRLVAAHGLTRRVHAGGLSVKQRLHLAALLIAFCALPLRAADDIQFSILTSPSDFQKFSRIIVQAIYATPVQPARASSIAGFDVGIAATLVNVDSNAAYWQHAVPNGSNFLVNGNYVGVPRLVVAKGFGLATISGTYAKVSNSSIKTY